MTNYSLFQTSIPQPNALWLTTVNTTLMKDHALSKRPTVFYVLPLLSPLKQSTLEVDGVRLDTKAIAKLQEKQPLTGTVKNCNMFEGLG